MCGVNAPCLDGQTPSAYTAVLPGGRLMRDERKLQRLTSVLVAVSVGALVVAFSTPRYHADVDGDAVASVSDADGSAGAWPHVEAFPATTPILHPVQVTTSWLVTFASCSRSQVPRFVLVVRATAPRAPPFLL